MDDEGEDWPAGVPHPTASTMERVMLDLYLGLPEAMSKVRSAPGASEFRRRIAKEIRDAKEAGMVLDFTPEFPDD